MPGPYAHITLLHELLRPGRPGAIFSSSSGFDAVLAAHLHYCALGAVSPDYANLVIGDTGASQWADVMHDTRVCEMITRGIGRVGSSRGIVRDKRLAWLLGYCAHVAADVTIHPVVQAKVGPYAQNQRQHRVCEMNQDSYIYRRMHMGEIGESDCFAQTVAQCSESGDRTQLDRDIVSLWSGMLEDVHPELFAAYPPDIALWHREFVARVSGCSAGSVRLFPLAGVISAKMGLEYPSYASIDRQYIEEQAVPSVRPLSLHYDDIFDHAAGTVTVLWRLVEKALCSGDEPVLPLPGDWNLDNGCDEHGRLVFWD
jgi:hypothetical protein